jgi:hypothetical protein
MKLNTSVCHQFYEFVIYAHWHGYDVRIFRNEQQAEYETKYDPHALRIEDWRQFLDQAPCPIPSDIADAIAGYFST